MRARDILPRLAVLSALTLILGLACGCMATTNEQGRISGTINLPAAAPGQPFASCGIPATPKTPPIAISGSVVFVNLQQDLTQDTTKPIEAGVSANTGLGDRAIDAAADVVAAGGGAAIAGPIGAGAAVAGKKTIQEAAPALKPASAKPKTPAAAAPK